MEFIINNAHLEKKRVELKEINKKEKKFTSLYVHKDIKLELDCLKVSNSESYNDVIRRLLKYRTWKVDDGRLIFTDSNDLTIIQSKDD